MYRLIHDGDIEVVRAAATRLRISENYDVRLLANEMANAFDKLLAQNEPAATEDEAEKALQSGRMDSHFSIRLVDLYRWADRGNRARLRAAFASVFKDYA